MATKKGTIDLGAMVYTSSCVVGVLDGQGNLCQSDDQLEGSVFKFVSGQTQWSIDIFYQRRACYQVVRFGQSGYGRYSESGQAGIT